MRPSIVTAAVLAAAVVLLSSPSIAGAAPVAPRDTSVSLAGCPIATANVGSPYFDMLKGSDPRAVYAVKGDLPPGITLNAESGALSGVPTDTGVWSVDLIAEARGETGEYGPCHIEVKPSLNPPRLATGCPIDDAVVGRPYRFQMAASGPSGMRFSASGLAAGLEVDAGSGLISGTPTALGSTTPTVSVSGLGGTSTRSGCAMTVRPPAAPAFLGCPPDTATVGEEYRAELKVRTEKDVPVDYSSSWLPAGLDLDNATGVLSGTPTTAGRTSVVFTSTNAWGGYARIDCGISVRSR